MNVFSFVTKEAFASMQERIKRREVFSYSQSAKCERNTITIRLESRFIDRDTAEKIWNGKNYLVHWNVDYRGKIGVGGSGRAYAEFTQFSDWETFKDWIDKHLERFEGYEVEQYGQLCLF